MFLCTQEHGVYVNKVVYMRFIPHHKHSIMECIYIYILHKAKDASYKGDQKPVAMREVLQSLKYKLIWLHV